MKIIFAIPVKALHVANVLINRAEERGVDAYDLCLHQEAISVVLRCQLTTSTGVDVMRLEVPNNEFALDVQNVLRQFGITNFIRREASPKRLTVSVLDLLDTHWMIWQFIGEKKLKITATDGTEHYLDWINDGANMEASISLEGYDAEDGALLMKSLKATETKFKLEY